MKLTIIIDNKQVYKNEICYSNLEWQGTPLNVHALQWFDSYGWIEFTDNSPNENITVLPEWANNALNAWEIANAPKPPPTPEEIQYQNKELASSLLQETDWTATVDISNPQYSNPYLMNQDAFLSYRSQVRQIAVNPPTTPTIFPDQPQAIWSN